MSGDDPSSSAADRPAVDESTGDDDASDPGERAGGEAGGAHIAVAWQATDCDPPASDWLEARLGHILALLEIGEADLSLAVVDDATMARLHEESCNEPGTTDVLTFDLRDEADEAPLEGELVLCIDEAARQAARQGHATRLELLLYAVHGMLHLLGEDDHDPAAARRMHQREDELLTAAGVGPVYHPNVGGGE